MKRASRENRTKRLQNNSRLQTQIKRKKRVRNHRRTTGLQTTVSPKKENARGPKRQKQSRKGLQRKQIPLQ